MTAASIRITSATRKQWETTLRHAFQAGDLALIKRVTALLGIGRGEPVPAVAASLGLSRSTIDAGLTAFLLHGSDGLHLQRKGGRPPKLTLTQRRRPAAIITAGPAAAGFPTGCWHALLIQQVIQREFKVTYNVHYVAALLHNLGCSFPKARFVSDHLDALARATGMTTTWPVWRDQAAAAGGRLLFGDQASFAQWGSLGYTWAPVGQQPTVQTTGRRKGYQVLGLIDYFSGRLFSQGIAGKLNAQNSQAFLDRVLDQTTEPLFLVQDGAPYQSPEATPASLLGGPPGPAAGHPVAQLLAG